MKQSGMTLVEVLVACVLVAVLGMGVLLFLQRDTHLQSRLRVHEWADVVLNSASALAQSTTLDALTPHNVKGQLQEGPTEWTYHAQWVSQHDTGDAIRVTVCERVSHLCWSRVVTRWRYASK